MKRPQGRPTHTEPTSRDQMALMLRRQGFLFREIGERLNVTRQRAEQLVRKAEQLMQVPRSA